MTRVLGLVVMAAGLVALGFGVREAIENWSLLWRWWFVGGIAAPGDLSLTLMLLIGGVAVVGFGLKVFRGEPLG